MNRLRIAMFLLSSAMVLAVVPSFAMAADNDFDDGDREVSGSAEAGMYEGSSSEPALVTAPSKKDETLVYNGREQELINPGEAVNGTIYYKLAGEDDYWWSTKVPVKRGAGAYSVEYYIKGDDGYTRTEISTIEGIEIKQCELSLPTGSCITKKYDGKKLSYFWPGDLGWDDVRDTLMANGDNGALITFNLNAANGGVGPDAGSYKDVQISLSGFSGSDYRIVAGGTVDVEITPRDFNNLVVSGVPTEPVIYRGEPIVPALTVTDSLIDKTLVEGTDYTVDIRDNDKTGSATVTITRAEGNVNYTPGSIIRAFDIVDADDRSPFLLNATVEGYRICLNVYVLSEGIDELHVTYDGEDPVMTDVEIGGIAYKRFTIASVAKEMADTRKLTIVADGITTEQDLSVADYLKILVRRSEYSLYHDLAAALLHYGAAAQTYFGYNTGNLANEGVDPLPAIPIDDLLEADGFDRTKLDSRLAVLNPDVTYAGMTLTFEEDLSLSLYFRSDKLSVDEVEHFVRQEIVLDPDSIDYDLIEDESDWEEYALSRKDVFVNGKYVGVTVRNISILDLFDCSYPVLAGFAECGDVRPLDYVIGMLKKAPDSNLGKLCRSLSEVSYYAEAIYDNQRFGG